MCMCACVHVYMCASVQVTDEIQKAVRKATKQSEFHNLILFNIKIK